ncbi:unnamed protein product [Bursaphelenchus okinawaensis]|uniref:Pepsin inhibitor-3-like repeated domain-containing protein n=1 Tax=Bursaphelenchus okinawaensis TaxID=465554 RepID=A0A811L6P8_9BILA|nr:unnamed protein product [Bursaphelenchus okinawaensis]CAG9116833.1 unnamed protein product [Bursaphelenchus okinawaensis]
MLSMDAIMCRNVITFEDVHMVNSPGCTVSGDMLVECDGTEREVSAEERLALDYYKEVIRKWNEDLGKFLGQARKNTNAKSFAVPDYPQFPPICKSCSE